MRPFAAQGRLQAVHIGQHLGRAANYSWAGMATQLGMGVEGTRQHRATAAPASPPGRCSRILKASRSVPGDHLGITPMVPSSYFSATA